MEEENAYEAERARRIASNRAKMLELGLEEVQARSAVSHPTPLFNLDCLLLCYCDIIRGGFDNPPAVLLQATTCTRKMDISQ